MGVGCRVQVYVQAIGLKFKGAGGQGLGLGFRVQGLGFRVQGFSFMVLGQESRVKSLGRRAYWVQG